MPPTLPRYTDAKTAAQLVAQLGREFAMVQNPGYVFPPYEAYPLAPRRQYLDKDMAGAVMDMDGTTTTTEPLCIHSLEMMVRRITGRPTQDLWPGLDHKRDYPHIIGNSTTKHVEYLIRTYDADIVPFELHRAYISAAAWTLGHAADEGRRNEVRGNLLALDAGDLLDDLRFAALQKPASHSAPEEQEALDRITDEYLKKWRIEGFDDTVRAAIDIYYQRYHEILGGIEAGRGEALAREVLGGEQHLIEPMPGIGVFLAMLKGLLGEDAEHLLPQLAETGTPAEADAAEMRDVLAGLGAYFERRDCKAALVTSSIAYEARIVLREVFRLLQQQAAQWDLPKQRREHVVSAFADPCSFYDAFITASDSSEIRLKPHRDLYCLALHRMGVPPQRFGQVVGFEDSESGTIAIRAAGIGLCCALPFTMTRDHPFDAASHKCVGGIPEVILQEKCFLPPETLEALLF